MRKQAIKASTLIASWPSEYRLSFMLQPPFSLTSGFFSKWDGSGGKKDFSMEKNSVDERNDFPARKIQSKRSCSS